MAAWWHFIHSYTPLLRDINPGQLSLAEMKEVILHVKEEQLKCSTCGALMAQRLGSAGSEVNDGSSQGLMYRNMCVCT